MGEPSLTWDWNLHCPVLVSNCLLRTLLPEECVQPDQATISRIKDQYQFTEFETLVRGGLGQEVNIPPTKQIKDGSIILDDDIQVLLLHKDLAVNGPDQKLETSPANTAGSVHICVQDPTMVHEDLLTFTAEEKALEVSERACLGGERSEEEGTAGATLAGRSSTTGNTPRGRALLRADVFQRGVPDVKTGILQPYPSVEMQYVLHRNVPTPLWRHTCALHLPEWPPIAADWVSRSRPHQFPRAELIEEIKKDGCFLVPEKGSVDNSRWQYSFENAEHKLFSSLTPLQKHVFVLLKTLCFQNLSSPQILQMEHLRALFLYAYERVAAFMWRADQLTSLVMYGLDSLLHLLIEGHLPHPFLPTINLFDGLSTDFTDQLQADIAQTRRLALKAFFKHSLTYRFKWTPPNLDADVFKPIQCVLDNSTSLENVIQCLIYAVVPFLARFWRASIAVGATDSAEQVDSTTKALDSLWQHIHREFEEAESAPHADLVSLFVLKEYKDDLLLQIRTYYYIIEHKHCTKTASFMANLACTYHSAYIAGVKEEYKTKAREMFQLAFSTGDMSIASQVDYAVFLCKMEEWEAARNLLAKITEHADSTGANGYTDDELQTLDTDLCSLGVALGGLEMLPSQAHALFLLLTTYVYLKAEETIIQTVLLIFEDWCAGVTEPSHRFLSYVTLGLAHERCGKNVDAHVAYRKAIKFTLTEDIKDRFTKWLSARPGCANICLEDNDLTAMTKNNDDVPIKNPRDSNMTGVSSAAGTVSDNTGTNAVSETASSTPASPSTVGASSPIDTSTSGIAVTCSADSVTEEEPSQAGLVPENKSHKEGAQVHQEHDNDKLLKNAAEKSLNINDN